MPANRKESESAPFWFQSAKGRPHGGLLQGAVGAGHAREQQGAGIGALLVPEPKVARMAASYIKKTGA